MSKKIESTPKTTRESGSITGSGKGKPQNDVPKGRTTSSGPSK